MTNIKYFVTIGDSPEEEVTKERFVEVERRAGFYNTMGQPHEPATGSFSSMPCFGASLSGRTEYS